MFASGFEIVLGAVVPLVAFIRFSLGPLICYIRSDKYRQSYEVKSTVCKLHDERALRGGKKGTVARTAAGPRPATKTFPDRDQGS